MKLPAPSFRGSFPHIVVKSETGGPTVSFQAIIDKAQDLRDTYKVNVQLTAFDNDNSPGGIVFEEGGQNLSLSPCLETIGKLDITASSNASAEVVERADKDFHTWLSSQSTNPVYYLA